MEKVRYYKCEPTFNGSYILKENLLYGSGKNCFLTKKEAIAHFEKAKKTALEKYKKIIYGISKLKEELGDFSYDCEVYALDDTGLETKIYLEFYIDDYCFRFEQ